MNDIQIRQLANEIIADVNSKIAALDVYGDGILSIKQNFELQRQFGRADAANALLELVALNARLGVSV